MGEDQSTVPFLHQTRRMVVREHADTHTNDVLLNACLSLADISSLGELERKLDHWLALLYAPCEWALSYAAEAEDLPTIEINSQPSISTPIAYQQCEAIHNWQRKEGCLTILFARHPSDAVQKSVRQVAIALAIGLRQLIHNLDALADTVELSFVRSLIYREGEARAWSDPDSLAQSLLVQLGVSSLHIVADSIGQGNLSWGISSRRSGFDIAPDQRARLHTLAMAVCAQLRKEGQANFLAHGGDLQTLAEEYDLPYLGHLGSLIIVPLQDDEQVFGAIIAGEERRWTRQPISGQTLHICAHLAHSISDSIARSQGIGRRIDHGIFTQLLVGSLDDAIITTEAGSVTSWNVAATSIFGYTDEEVRGRALTEILPVLATARDSSLNGLIQSQSPVEVTMRAIGGRELILHWKQTRLRGLSGETPVVVHVFREIGRERELEQLKDELLSMVSHELRTPLNGINGFGRLLLERPHMPEPMRREALEMLQSSVERLTRLAEDFIDLARARRHRLPLELEEVAVGSIITATIRELRRRHPDHIIRMYVRKHLPTIQADSLRVKQILDNLVSNAAKYAPIGSVISIAVRQRDDTIAVSVTDHGPGIPKELQSRIFESFYRAAPRGHSTGVGLGLNIVKTLVEAHGGTVTLRSSPGHGSTFMFTLKLRPTHILDDDPVLE